MRYYEFSHLAESNLNETLLNEAFLDSVKKAIGNKVTQQVSNVTNTASALEVMYKVISDPKYLETTVFELKRSIKNKIKSLPDGQFKKAVIAAFPQGRGLRDFLKGLLLVSVINVVIAAKGAVKDQAMETIISNVVNLENIIGQLINIGISGLGPVMKSLGIANVILFQVLADINNKIKSINIK